MERLVYLGSQWGSFEDEKSGRQVHYAHIFVMSDFEGGDNPDYHTSGYKGDKYKLKDASVLKGLDLAPLDVIEAYFDKKGKVTKIIPVQDQTADDWMGAQAEAE